jgi:hypothetical protein
MPIGLPSSKIPVEACVTWPVTPVYGGVFRVGEGTKVGTALEGAQPDMQEMPILQGLERWPSG